MMFKTPAWARTISLFVALVTSAVLVGACGQTGMDREKRIAARRPLVDPAGDGRDLAFAQRRVVAICADRPVGNVMLDNRRRQSTPRFADVLTEHRVLSYI